MDKNTEDVFDYRAGMMINRAIKMGICSVSDVISNAIISNNPSFIYVVSKYVVNVLVDDLTNAMYASKDEYWIRRYEEDILGSYSKKKSI